MGLSNPARPEAMISPVAGSIAGDNRPCSAATCQCSNTRDETLRDDPRAGHEDGGSPGGAGIPSCGQDNQTSCCPRAVSSGQQRSPNGAPRYTPPAAQRASPDTVDRFPSSQPQAPPAGLRSRMAPEQTLDSDSLLSHGRIHGDRSLTWIRIHRPRFAGWSLIGSCQAAMEHLLGLSVDIGNTVYPQEGHSPLDRLARITPIILEIDYSRSSVEGSLMNLLEYLQVH